MIDPVTALATATTAFNVIKKGLQFGRDIESFFNKEDRRCRSVKLGLK